MIIYILLFVTFVGGLAVSKEKDAKLLLLMLLWLTAALLVGLRGESVGIDTAAYFKIFNFIKYDLEVEYVARKIQPLYVFLNQAADFLNGGPPLALFFAAAITLYCVLSTVFKFSPNMALSIAVFFSLELFFFMHNVVRQALAASVIFYSIRYISSRQLLLFLLMVFTASMFHISAIICLPFYFLNRLNLDYKWLLIIWLVSLLFFINGNLVYILFNELTPYLPSQYKHFPQFIAAFEKSSQSLGLLQSFKQAIFMLLLYVYAKDRSASNNKTILLIALFSIVFSNIFYHIGLINRINSYFSVFLILAIPIAIEFVFRQYDKVIVNYTLYLALFLVYLRSLYTDGHAIFPYSSSLF